MEKDISYQNQKKLITNIMVMSMDDFGRRIIHNIPKEKFLNTKFAWIKSSNIESDDFELNNYSQFHSYLKNEKIIHNSYIKTNDELIQISNSEIKKIFSDLKILILIANLENNFDYDAIKLITSIAKDMGIITISIVTKPVSFDSLNKKESYFYNIEELKNSVNSISVISNDKLFKNFPDINLNDSFQLLTNYFQKYIKCFFDLVNNESLIKFDFKEIKNILQKENDIYISFGNGIGRNKISRAIKSALNSKVMELKLENVDNLIISIVADSKVSIQEVNKILEQIKEEISFDANLIFSFDIDNKLRDEIRISIITCSSKNKYKNRLSSSLNDQEILIKIGNTLELEMIGQQSIESTEIKFNDFDCKKNNSKKSITSYDETNNIDIPLFLK